MKTSNKPAMGILALLLMPTALLGHDAPDASQTEASGEVQWLAGDHHVHSRFSVRMDETTNPPTPVMAGDAIYPIPMNAVMARRHGLDWMVSTDHGGPNHAKINLEHAYPELVGSRAAVPEVIQFFGMEFDTPGADHSSLIMPHSHDESEHLHSIESRFNKREPWPVNPEWDTMARMLEALEAMKELPQPPVVIAHHPSRSAQEVGVYGLTSPEELRAWNDTAPDIAVGMEGSPGHQAAALMQPRFAPSNHAEHFETRPRGAYRGSPTMGGYDQMTARVGGFWDSMLGEGRRWWITANSDSHIHWSDGGADFWPGEYSKTYVLAEKNHASLLDAIRHGRVFVTTGDLISELWLTVSSGNDEAGIGSRLNLDEASDLKVSIRFLDPDEKNFNGDNPLVNRVDLITGRISGAVKDASTDSNASTMVQARYGRDDWRRDGDYWVIEHVLENVDAPIYLRVRGTNTDQLEPEPDPANENPWADLWFYSNPVFVEFAE